MGQFINLKAADGFTVPAYVAEPQGKARGAVVVVQKIFGVNSHIRSVADRFAGEGYLAVAPATFERVKSGVDLGYTEADMNAGFALKTAVTELPGRACCKTFKPQSTTQPQPGAARSASSVFAGAGC